MAPAKTKTPVNILVGAQVLGGRLLSSSVTSWPNPVDSGISAKFGRTPTACGAMPTTLRAAPTNSGASSAKSGRSILQRFRPLVSEVDKSWSDFGQLRPNLGQANLGQASPTLALAACRTKTALVKICATVPRLTLWLANIFAGADRRGEPANPVLREVLRPPLQGISGYLQSSSLGDHNQGGWLERRCVRYQAVSERRVVIADLYWQHFIRLSVAPVAHRTRLLGLFVTMGYSANESGP